MKHTSEAISIVREFIDKTVNKGEYPNGLEYKVYIVSSYYVLGNEKYFISSDLPDGKYYEVTYNEQKKEFYFDAYVRVENRAYKMGVK